MKLSNIFEKEYAIVDKKKIFFLIPVAIVFITAVCMLIYGLVFGSPLNLGMDFTGGYSIDVSLGTKLTDDNYESVKSRIVDITEGLTDDNGTAYGLKVGNVQRQGSGEDAAIRVTYGAVGEERLMDETINPRLQQKLQESIFRIIPEKVVEGNVLKFNYNVSVETGFSSVKSRMEKALADNSASGSVTLSENGFTITVTPSSALNEAAANAVTSAATVDDKYSGLVSGGDAVSASFSAELLWSAAAAILASVVLMLVYIAFRFELLSGLSAIVALFHDITMMFCFMVIFRVEINSTFIAALITILGYSINNTIIIFDRVRENVAGDLKGASAAVIADKSVNETLLRSLNTTLTTLLTIGMVAVLGVPDIKIFALPIIMGLLAGTYSSICIAPSVWSAWKDRKKSPMLDSKKEVEKAKA